MSLFILSACSRPSGQVSHLAIQIPNSSELANVKNHQNDQVTKLAATYDQMCFGANVTAQDIVGTKASTCDIALGFFAQPVAPGQTLSLSVTQGTNRNLQIFAFLKKSSADSCPNFQTGFDKFDRSRIYVLGQKTFDVLSDPTNVSVDLSLPDPSLTLQTLNSFPDSCDFLPTPVPTSLAGIGEGSAHSSGGSFVVRGRVRQVDNMTKISGGNFVVKMGRVQ